MSYQSFMIIESLLHEQIPIERNCSVTTIIKLRFLIRWISGGSHHDIMVTVGVCKETFYHIIDQWIIDIVTCDELSYHFPTTTDEITDIVSYCNYFSEGSIITGCVGCVDGFLININTPSKKETFNEKDYYSGNYQCNGINIQDACDRKFIFISFIVSSTGANNDIIAFK